MEEIKAIVKENDIAAFVVLHDEMGISEYLNAVSPSYSCARIENGHLGVRLKGSEVGKEEAQRLADRTFNLITHFANVIGRHATMYKETQSFLKNKWGGDEFDSDHTSHEQQNN